MSQLEAVNGGTPPEPKLHGIVNRLIESIRQMSPGDRAELRRARADEPGGPAFWRLAVHVLAPANEISLEGAGREHRERRWAVILAALATIEDLHAPGIRLGRALARAGLSELRLVRLLRASDDGLFHLVRTTVHYLSSKREPVDCADIALLVLSDGRSDEASVRRRIARDYYANLEA